MSEPATPRVLRCGDRAVLVELAGYRQALALGQSLGADPPTGVVELVPAARTILLEFDPGRTDPERLAAVVRERHATARTANDSAGQSAVRVPVRYDGPDLPEVAELTGLGRREVIDRHTGTECTAAFCGFAPGFAYLAGIDPALRVPRRDSPRTRVPAGAVGLAGEFTAVYPRSSPGGWQLIGHTDLVLWDTSADPPALLTPGTRVRFVEADE